MEKRKKIDIIDIFITLFIIVIITILGLTTYYKFYYAKDKQEENKQEESKVLKEAFAHMQNLNNYNLSFKIEADKKVKYVNINYHTYEKFEGSSFLKEDDQTLESPFYLFKDEEGLILFYYEPYEEKWKKTLLEDLEKDTLLIGKRIVANLKNIEKNLDIKEEKEIKPNVLRLTGIIKEEGIIGIFTKEEVEINKKDQIKFIIDINQVDKYIVNLIFRVNDLKTISIKFDKINKIENFNIPEGVLSSITEEENENEIEETEVEEEGIQTISFERYLELLDSSSKNLIYIGSNECPHCERVEPIYKKITEDLDLIIYYLNLDDLKEEERERFYQTDEIFSKRWGTPLLMVYNNKSLIDYYMGYGDYETISDFVVSR